MSKHLAVIFSAIVIGGVFYFSDWKIKSGDTNTESQNKNDKALIKKAEAGTTCPAQLLDLTDWKQTLPTGSAGKPAEIKQDSLATFLSEPYFCLNAENNGVKFRAPVNGVTTSGSSYPRSELREMANGGKDMANWSTTSGTHTMFIDEAITSVPKNKKHVVAGQIHNADDDVIVIRLEYPKLFVDINGQEGPTLDPNYTLGKRFTVKFVAQNGQIKIYYNGQKTPAYTLSKKTSGCYFKAGCYTQSNCSKETDCSNNNYGEVVIYDLAVTHSDSNKEISTPGSPPAAPSPTPDPTPSPDPAPSDTSVTSFEAEGGLLKSPMKISSDDFASGQKYISQTAASKTGSVKYVLEMPNGGKYQLRARVIAKGGSSNSVYYSFDNKTKKSLAFSRQYYRMDLG